VRTGSMPTGDRAEHPSNATVPGVTPADRELRR
jgi:hypothetical protein